MKIFPISIEDRGFFWTLCPFTGNLLKYKTLPHLKSKPPAKISEALTVCDDPYKCYMSAEVSAGSFSKQTQFLLERMHSRLQLIGNKRFFLSRLYASMRQPLFGTTQSALNAISKLPAQQECRDKLCLQRSLLAIKVSRSFPITGVFFIGVQLATLEMHAWIIEDQSQPDYEDRSWINYRPILAMSY